MRFFNIIVAVDLSLGIGKNGMLPWHLSGDMEHFKRVTESTESASQKNAVIMGRKTWESLPKKFRPLPRRLNVVLTHSKNLTVPEGVLKTESLTQALVLLDEGTFKDSIETVFVIGGGQIFQEALKNPNCQKIYLTQILSQFDCDVFFPEFKNEFREEFVSSHFSENPTKYYFAVYSRP